MAKFFEKVIPTSASKAEAVALLPEPDVTFEVEAGITDENGETTGAAVIMHVRFPLDYDESLAKMRKRSLIIGETRAPVPVSFDVEGEPEPQTLVVDGNVFRGAATLSIYMEDKKGAEQKETGGEAGGEPETAEDTGATPAVV